MSALANSRWNSGSNLTAVALPFPVAAEEKALSNRIRILRDTLLVLGLQIVFRATMALRRWNY